MSPLPDDPRPLPDEYVEIAQMLVKQQESDRGCVIFCAAWLEDELEILIRAHCRKEPNVLKAVVDPLFKGYAPLSTFSAKIQVCYAMGFISKHLHKSLQLVRKLRNDFAHEKIGVSFQSPKYRPQFRGTLLSASRDEPKDKTEVVHDSDSERLPNWGITKGQLIDRLAFCLAVARMIGRIRGRQDMAVLVKDNMALADECDAKNVG
jgi:DNA-binding MltR family transcriptional regulator